MRQQGVIETPETVGHDEEHGKFQEARRHRPPLNWAVTGVSHPPTPLDQEGAPPASMMPKPPIQFTDVQLSIFKARSDQRSHGVTQAR